MHLKWPILSAAAFALAALATPASAAPASLEGIKGNTPSAAEHVAYRRCWWHRGHRHCRWVEDGYGYGPGVNLYFDGRRGHRHHHHHHR